MPDIPQGVPVVDLSSTARFMTEARARLGNAWDALFGRKFGPNMPIQPTDPSLSEDGPRQYQYPAGYNMNFGLPRQEDPLLKLTPFSQMRALAESYDIATLCITTRIEEIQGLTWAVVPKDKKKQAEYQSECDEVSEFFKHPDKLNDFNGWLGMLLWELFSTDTMTIYKRRTLNGELYALEPVDGTTIKPLIDDRGRTLAYQQILYGYPESQFDRPYTEARDENLPIYTPNELMYLPRWLRTYTPYGFPPTEWIILRINTALRKQKFDLNYFTEGNIPEMLGWPPEGMLDPKQVQEFEQWFNQALLGNDAARRRLKFLPWPADIKELRQFSYDTVLDLFMLKVTCAAFAVPPTEIGFIEDANRATAQIQEAVNERRGLKPLVNWLKKAVFDEIIHNDLKKPHLVMEVKFGDKVDALVEAQSDQIYISSGVVSPAEVRTMRFGSVLDGPPPPMPPQIGQQQMGIGPLSISDGYGQLSVNGQAYPKAAASGGRREYPFRYTKGWESYG